MCQGGTQVCRVVANPPDWFSLRDWRRVTGMIRHTLVTVASAAGLALSAVAPALAAQPYPVNFKTFSLAAADATRSGTVLSGGSLTLDSSGLGSFAYTDPYANYNGDGVAGSGEYVSGTWTSGVTTLTFPFSQLVASWNVQTPAGTWVQVEVKPRLDDGHWAKWYILGR